MISSLGYILSLSCRRVVRVMMASSNCWFHSTHKIRSDKRSETCERSDRCVAQQPLFSTHHLHRYIWVFPLSDHERPSNGYGTQTVGLAGEQPVTRLNDAEECPLTVINPLRRNIRPSRWYAWLTAAAKFKTPKIWYLGTFQGRYHSPHRFVDSLSTRWGNHPNPGVQWKALFGD